MPPNETSFRLVFVSLPEHKTVANLRLDFGTLEKYFQKEKATGFKPESKRLLRANKMIISLKIDLSISFWKFPNLPSSEVDLP